MEMLHGTRVEISFVKVGGTGETIMSNRYLLPLIDSQGQVVPFEVSGIDVITADIQSVNVNNVVHRFKDVMFDRWSGRTYRIWTPWIPPRARTDVRSFTVADN